jgi:hypothetical protein
MGFLCFLGEVFIHRIVVGDYIWVHHCDAENKRPHVEYRHTAAATAAKNSVQKTLLEKPC